MSNRYGKRYTKQFKEEAVRLLLTSGKPTQQMARDLGVSDVALGEWKREALRNSGQPETANPKGLWINPVILEQENLRLKQEVETLRQQRDILKKSLGILSQGPLPGGMP
jgi:transposase